MNKIIYHILLATIWLANGPASGQEKKPIRQSDIYSVYHDRVEQKPYTAKAVSEKEIVSDYESPANQFISPRITFKFSINGKDNEMVSGRDHQFACVAENGKCDTMLVKFGEQFVDQTEIPAGVYLQPDTDWTIRLDMRHVFAQFKSKGFFETFNGARIYKDDFKGVYVAGNVAPLTWDFDNLHNYKNLELHDEDGDFIYEVTLRLNVQQDKRETNSNWNLSLDVSSFPQYKSSYVLVDALYNLALEEMIRAVEKDSTLRTGKEWAGVWTRDVSYSIILSMAILQPKVAQYSLLRKVKNGVIIQDTGTGGAYPVSTDRMIWAVAAYEIYKVTGERKWLETVYPIIKKSLEDDLKNAIDAKTGLVKGESSFLDWREQTYPRWMEPADIFESQCLGTNAAHYQAHIVLSRMAEELKELTTAEKHRKVAAEIKKGINTHLWMADRGYYGQFLYGRNYKILSPRSEALGEALCVLFDIADPDQQRKIVANTPVNEFGIPCIYPQIPNIPPYHNNGIWPFVQSYWTMASAKAGNEKAVIESLSAIYRPAALFLTNKENFVAETGDHVGTQINSDNMLWSLAGKIGMVYKVLFGMEYSSTGLSFKPFVPRALAGKQVLSNYRYRDASLDVELNGYGNRIRSITLDGQPLKGEIPSNLKGKHTVVIQLANNQMQGDVNMAIHYTAPETPMVSLENNRLSWSAVPGAMRYRILRNGRELQIVIAPSYAFNDRSTAEYQVISLDKDNVESFASEPVLYVPTKNQTIIELENVIPKAKLDYKGFSGNGFVETSVSKNPVINFVVTVEEPGMYAIDFRYANGNGPVNTENKCGIRTLKYNNKLIGTVVFPQRGTGEWSDWGFTNSIRISLKKGANNVSLSYEQHNMNMNVDVNDAVIDYVRIIKMETSAKNQ